MTKALVSISFVVLCVQSAVHRGGDGGGGGGVDRQYTEYNPHHPPLLPDGG